MANQPQDQQSEESSDSPAAKRPQLGKWGNKYHLSLVENRPDLVKGMSDAEIVARCREVNRDAEQMLAVLKKQGVKQDAAEEIVLAELVLVPDLETSKAMQDGYTD